MLFWFDAEVLGPKRENVNTICKCIGSTPTNIEVFCDKT